MADLRQLASRLSRHRALGIGFIAQTVQYGAALLLVPFMVTRLSAAEVGIWYIFIALQSLAFVCDFGFQPSFTRAFAFAASGAERLERQGIGRAVPEGRPPNYRLFVETLAAAHRFYGLLAIGVVMLLLAGGLPYVSILAKRDAMDVASVQIAYLIFTASVGLYLTFLWITPVLMGSGRVEKNYLFIIAARGLAAILGIAALLMGGGLIALSVAFVVAQIVARVVAMPFLNGLTGGLAVRDVDKRARREMLSIIWPNAGRMGAVSIGGFLITRYSLFAISSFAGLGVGGAYALSLQMFTALNSVSQLPMQVSIPQLISARVASNGRYLRRRFIFAMAMFLALFTLGALTIIFVIPPALALIGSNVALLPLPALILLAAIMLLEGFHSNAAFFITTGNDVPFLRAALISGLAVVATTTIAGWFGAGLLILIACQGLVQLAYNNWRWPLLAWREIARI